ncbi:cancer-related nucleoside-triphosphatase homolog, partial [Eriocheir sinensis]|uniref:cancer-related nucleoside-triphosphatase homolog n=1 Tax=Eriocheir sinensis TaxID=95602 RepID=UPI0021CAC073
HQDQDQDQADQRAPTHLPAAPHTDLKCLAIASACIHVAVTGPPGVGKTTLIQKVVGRLQEAEVACSGFYTKEVRQGGKRVGFDVVTLSSRVIWKRKLLRPGALFMLASGGSEKGWMWGINKINISDRAEGSGGREPRVGNYVADVASFESLALSLLQTQRASPSVLVLNEIGKMEMLSAGFVRGVRQAIADPSSTLLASIPVAKGKPIALVEEIRSSPTFMVVNLTRASRDDPAVLEKIISTLRTSLEK